MTRTCGGGGCRRGCVCWSVSPPLLPPVEPLLLSGLPGRLAVPIRGAMVERIWLYNVGIMGFATSELLDPICQTTGSHSFTRFPVRNWTDFLLVWFKCKGPFTLSVRVNAAAMALEHSFIEYNRVTPKWVQPHSAVTPLFSIRKSVASVTAALTLSVKGLKNLLLFTLWLTLWPITIGFAPFPSCSICCCIQLSLGGVTGGVINNGVVFGVGGINSNEYASYCWKRNNFHTKITQLNVKLSHFHLST